MSSESLESFWRLSLFRLSLPVPELLSSESLESFCRLSLFRLSLPSPELFVVRELLSLSSSWPSSSSRFPVVLVLVLGLRSRLGERPVQGGTDGRRGSAGCVVDLRVRARSAGEGSPTARGVGARRDHADGRGRGTRRPTGKSPLSFSGFCMDVVAPVL